jgi:hypothetical protein
MLRVHASGLWKVIAKLSAKAKSGRSAAVAYLTSEENVQFGKDDLLIVDASDDSIAGGATSAKLVKTLFERGVRLYSVRGLHAKVFLLGDTAVVGSANLSKHSMSLIEAAVVSDRPEAVAGAAYFIETLRTHKSAKRVDAAFVKRAMSIPVAKPTGSKGSVGIGEDASLIVPEPKTWLLGLFELDDDQFPKEQQHVQKGSTQAARLLDVDEDDVEWIRYPWSWRFAQEARAGDNVIQVWRDTRHHKAPSHVFRATPIVMRQDEATCVRFFPRPQEECVTWKTFLKQWSKLGYARPPGLNAERLLSAKDAALLDGLWE